jgi:hypothetical protein
MVVAISWLVGTLCGYGITQVFDTGCDQPTNTEQPDAQRQARASDCRPRELSLLQFDPK